MISNRVLNVLLITMGIWPGCPIKVSLEQQSEHYIWHCSDLFVGFKDGVGAVVAVIVVPNINSIHLKRRKWGKTFNIKKNLKNIVQLSKSTNYVVLYIFMYGPTMHLALINFT